MTQNQTPMTAIKSDYKNESNPPHEYETSYAKGKSDFQPPLSAEGYTAALANNTATSRYEPLPEGHNSPGMYHRSAQSHGCRESEDANVDHGYREDRTNYTGEGRGGDPGHHGYSESRSGTGYAGEARGVSGYGEPIDDGYGQSKGAGGYGEAM